ncbi:MAG: methyl-accepting chemotaxis protein [bacterium]|jgi:methyl-accepting chemotaxis protein
MEEQKKIIIHQKQLQTWLPFLMLGGVVISFFILWILQSILNSGSGSILLPILSACILSILFGVSYYLVLNNFLNQERKNETGNTQKNTTDTLLEDVFSSQKEIHQLMENHLSSVIGETDDAAMEITEQLEETQHLMERLRQKIEEKQKEAKELAVQSNSTIHENQDTIEKLQVYIEKRLDDIQRDQKIGKDFSEHARVMSNMVSLLKGLSNKTNLLALNAAIEAAKAGEFGKGFAVVADAVRNLSGQSDHATKEIGKAIEKMVHSVEKEFNEKLNAEKQKDESTMLAHLKDQLTALISSYQRLDNLNQESLLQVQDSSTEVTQQTMATLSAIQFQDITRQQIEIILKGLNFFDNYMVEFTDFLGDDPQSKKDFEKFDMEEVRSMYVMAKQRVIHEKTFDNQEKSTTSESESITFF